MLWTESPNLAVRHGKHLIQAGKRAWPMGYYDGYAITVADSLDSRGQTGLSFRIQVGIRLIENDKKRIAIERAGECNSLPLAGREGRACLSNAGLIAIRETHDEIMDPRSPCGTKNFLGRCIRLKASDVLGNGAVEQLHVLGKVSYMPAQLLLLPLVQRGTIKSDGSRYR